MNKIKKGLLVLLIKEVLALSVYSYYLKPKHEGNVDSKTLKKKLRCIFD
jgi:hypothetical protein